MNSAGDIFDGLRTRTEFTVTEDHLKLLRRTYVGWDDCEFGAPALDCKRPYGNSDVTRDIGEILGVPAEQYMDADEYVLPDYDKAFTILHAETGIALQIALATGEFRAGHYARSKYGSDWKLSDAIG